MSTYKRQDKKFKAKLSAIADRKQTQVEERILKASWHTAISLVGLWELRSHKSLVGRLLALGLIAFHLDAGYFDLIDRPTTLQRILRRLR
jgi:hypothetical protein